jgi:hypothetical protein
MRKLASLVLAGCGFAIGVALLISPWLDGRFSRFWAVLGASIIGGSFAWLYDDFIAPALHPQAER